MSSLDKTSVLEEQPAFTRQRKGGTFLVITGPDRGEQCSLVDDEVSFGSGPTCDLVLSDKTVSRKHAVAVLQGDEVIVRDAGSTNGSFVHGAKFKEIAVSFGAEIKLGRTVIKFLPNEEVVEPAASESPTFGQLIGRNQKMRRLFGLLKDIAPTDATVLIEGETGTGKELIAEETHNHSKRQGKPFVVVDCGSIPRELIESALFGHVKGSFTGAVSDRKGAFAEANGGTIFLDEIGELPIDMQPSLLRVLDKKAVRKVGANAYEKVDVRVVAATNRDLREEIGKKNFREDLYYRLAVIRVNLPPLRERGDDIPILVEHFLKSFASNRETRVTPDDMTRLRTYGWPGNVRELRNVMERACVLSRGNQTLSFDEVLGADSVSQANNIGVRTDLPFKEAKGQLVEAFEREYIVDLMKRHRMNLSAAAREAQIDRKHLRELIRKYGMDPRATDNDSDDE